MAVRSKLLTYTIERNYPYLGVREGDEIVLFYKQGEGIILKKGDGESSLPGTVRASGGLNLSNEECGGIPIKILPSEEMSLFSVFKGILSLTNEDV